jgi:hypothetical protein
LMQKARCLNGSRLPSSRCSWSRRLCSASGRISSVPAKVPTHRPSVLSRRRMARRLPTKHRQAVLPSSAAMAPSNAAITSACERSGSTFQC